MNAQRKASSKVADEKALRATDGRVPGTRGLATRHRLLECTAELLAGTSYRDIKVIQIARKAGTSPATFYQYFPDVEHAILVLAEESAQEALALAGVVGGDWRGEKGYRTARTLVERFTEYWDAHRAVFRVIDLATEEGDLRFQQLRTRALRSLAEALRDAIATSQREGRLPGSVEPMATAAVLVSMLAHVGAHRYGMEFWGIRTSHLNEVQTRLIYWTVTGRKPPTADAALGSAR